MASLGLESRVLNVSSLDDDGDGAVVWGILRAPRGDGKEGLALSTHWSADGQGSSSPGSCDGVGMMLSVAAYLARQNWLAKDVVFVATAHPRGIAEWVAHYVGREARAGALQAALCLDIACQARSAAFSVLLHGLNGQLPNLDMLNAMVRIAGREGADGFVTIEAPAAMARTGVWGALDGALGPYVPRKLVNFMARQALGVPTGDHGWFTKYRVDAVTISTDHPVTSSSVRAIAQKDVAKHVISLLRSLNNLLEHLHQSFYFYVLTGPSRYLSIAEYSVSLGLLLAPLLFAILPAVWLDPTSIASIRHEATIPRSAHLAAFRSLVEVCMIHVVCIGSYAAAFWAIPAGLAAPWALASLAAAVLLLFGVLPTIGNRLAPGGPDGRLWRVFSLVPVAVFLSTFSLVNFSFCALASIITVPLALAFSSPASSKSLRLLQIAGALAFSLPSFVLAIAPQLGYTSPASFLIEVFNQHSNFTTLLFPFAILFYFPMNLAHIRLLIIS
jgi:glycosylphosphatidylinositol transamidase